MMPLSENPAKSRPHNRCNPCNRHDRSPCAGFWETAQECGDNSLPPWLHRASFSCGQNTFHHEVDTMSNATLERKCDLPQLVLECILLDSKVPVKHWTEWFDLVVLRYPPVRCGAPLPGVRHGPPCHLDGHFRTVLPGEGNQVSSEGLDTLQEAAYKRCLTATHRHQFVHFRQRPRAIMRGYRGDSAHRPNRANLVPTCAKK